MCARARVCVRSMACRSRMHPHAHIHTHTCTCMQDPGSPGSVHSHLSDFEHVRAHTHAVPARLTNVPNVSLQRLLLHECDLTSLCRCATRTTVCLRPLARALRPKSRVSWSWSWRCTSRSSACALRTSLRRPLRMCRLTTPSNASPAPREVCSYVCSVSRHCASCHL